MPDLFINPSYLAGSALIASPIIIHLINRMRFRRVRWATMEFLFESQRKNRRRILLKQLLLLLMRILLILLFVCLVARPFVGANLILGDERTHDVIVLDDSCSMNDRWADTNAFDQARNTIMQLARSAAARPGTHAFTLIRLSQIDKPDLLREMIDDGAVARLNGLVESLKATHGSHKLLGALKEAERMFAEDKGLNKSLHIISDFREKDWLSEDALSQKLLKIEEDEVTLNLIRTIDEQHQNRSLVDIQLKARNVAANVPIQFVATVKNLGPGSTESFEMEIEVDGKQLPAARLDPLPAGQAVKHPFEIVFDAPGRHVLRVALPKDALTPDDERFMVLNIQDTIPALVVRAETDDPVDYISFALSPGGDSQTGIEPVVRTPDSLNTESLDDYPMIFFSNVPKLKEAGVKAVDAYIRNGGGLVIFLGSQIEAPYYNQYLYAEGNGFLPAPLASPNQVEQDFFGSAGRLQFETHPVFKVFAGERNPFIQSVRVSRSFSLTEGWQPDENTAIVARLSTGEPYVVEKRYGEGRVMMFLSGLSEEWTNWPKNPSFVITMLQLQSSLAREGGSGMSTDVGLPLEIVVDAQNYTKDMTVSMPKAAGEGRAIRVTAVPAQDPTKLKTVFEDTHYSGIYDVLLSPIGTPPEKRPFAYNIHAAEGDLTLVTRAQLGERLKGSEFHFQDASSIQWIDSDSDQNELTDLIVAALVLLLLAEQLLACHLSYHHK